MPSIGERGQLDPTDVNENTLPQANRENGPSTIDHSAHSLRARAEGTVPAGTGGFHLKDIS